MATEVQDAAASVPGSSTETIEGPALRVPSNAGKGQPAGESAKKKGAKGAKEANPATADGSAPSVAAHPRAARAVARSKGWGGLGGFLLGGYLSLPTSTLAGAGLRALEAGVVGYIAVWAGAVFIWRRLVILELKGREQELLARARSQLPAASASAAEQGRARIS